MDQDQVDDDLARQLGVISRRQVLAAGGTDADIERLLRRRIWARVHPGVYVDHTGPLSAHQRAWAALLLCWPAALAAGSALRAHGLRVSGVDDGITDVAVAAHRRLDVPRTIRLTRLSDFESTAKLHLLPPRVGLEHALLTEASRATDDDGAVALLADACQTRRTTPGRLVDELARMPRLRRRHLLTTVLADVAAGSCSALERRYLVHVERPHGLPTGCRQRRVRTGRTVAYRDVEYLGLRTVVELDGRLGHTGVARAWADLERDVAGVLAGDVTIRIGWGPVLRPCRVATVVGRVLTARGWRGRVRGCGPGCPA
jgi:hypothetical protein